MPTVSVVVLSYNRPYQLREALRSVVAQTYPLAELIVVDNCSPLSAEIAAAAAQYPTVRLIAQPTNLGFAGGMNSGLAVAAGEYVLLTEDDIVLEPEAVAALVANANRHPRGVYGAVMLNWATRTVRCAGGQIVLGSRLKFEVIGEGAPDDGRFAAPFAVTYLPGAFLFSARSTWIALGGFRDVYYLYMEDVDLCLRAAEAGVELEVVPEARVWHFDPPDGPPPAWLERLKARNLLRLYLLNAPLWVLPAFVTRTALWSSVRNLVLSPRAGWNQCVALFLTICELPRLLLMRWLSRP